jgi:hypothetical protein
MSILDETNHISMTVKCARRVVKVDKRFNHNAILCIKIPVQ